MAALSGSFEETLVKLRNANLDKSMSNHKVHLANKSPAIPSEFNIISSISSFL